MNVTNFLLQTANSTYAAIQTEKETFTYNDLRCNVGATMYSLVQNGIKPGDRVALIGDNSFEWCVWYLAIIAVGAISVPLNPKDSTENIISLLRFIDVHSICADHRWYTILQNVKHRYKLLLLQANNMKPHIEFSSFLYTPPKPDQLAALMPTSGTTSGTPKLVCVTHRNIISNTESIISALKLSSQEKILAILPFFYCFGTSLLHTHLRVGGTVAISNSFAFPEIVLNFLEDTQCTGFAGVPSIYHRLLRNSTFPQRKLTHLKTIQQAGGKLQDPLINELQAALPYADIYIMYGQTEATARLSYLSPEALQTKKGSIGQGLPGVSLAVVDSDGQLVQPGQIGEIVASGENISPGYWKNQNASKEKFKRGQLWTGDMATIDEDGFIYVVDRKSDFIKQNGFRISSRMVESYLLSHTNVIDAAAVGIPDIELGEAIFVFVTLLKHTPESTNVIINHCRKSMPRYILPQKIVVVDQFPLNEQGKVLKRVLRDWAMQENQDVRNRQYYASQFG